MPWRPTSSPRSTTSRPWSPPGSTRTPTSDPRRTMPGSTVAEALAREGEALSDLVSSDATSASLYSAELLRRGKPGRTPVEGARELRKVGVAGAGLMASQIAAQLAIGLQVPVVMRDL